MANPVSVPVFSGKSSLALSDLDAMADCVRDAQLKIGTLGGHTHRGHAQPGHAWYLPAAAAQEYGATSPRIAPGLVGGLKISREFTAPLIANGTVYFPMAHMETRHEIDPEDDTVAYLPGAIDAIEVREDSPAGLDYGTIVLPLAQSPTMEKDDLTGAEYALEDGWAGLIQGVEFAGGIERPSFNNGLLQFPLAQATSDVAGCTVSSIPGAIAGVQADSSLTAPYIDNGILYLPAGREQAPLARFGAEIPTTVAGLVKGGVFASVAAVAAYEGVLYFPLAQAAAATGCTVSSVPGALRGAMSDTSLPGGGIYNGVLYFPLADSNYNRPGVIRGVTQQPGYPLGDFRDGILYFPTTDELPGVVDTGGTSRPWSEVVSSVGEQFEVASISLRVGANNYVPLSLHVGRNAGGYLTFSFTS